MSQFNNLSTPGTQPLPNAGKAVASLVLGIVSIPTCILYGLPAIICGILAVVFQKQAMQQIYNGERNPNSLGMAKAGMICGYVGLGLGVTYILLLIVVIIVSVANA